MSRAGTFRQDLLYRLNTVTIPVPPLRERVSEIRPLVALFIANASRVGGRDVRFSDSALEALEAHRWPGNVRELRNVVERAVIMALREEVDVSDLPPAVVGGPKDHPTAPPVDGEGQPLRDQLRRFEAQLILNAMRACDFNKTRAAEHLGIPVRTLSHKIQALGLKDQLAQAKAAG